MRRYSAIENKKRSFLRLAIALLIVSIVYVSGTISCYADKFHSPDEYYDGFEIRGIYYGDDGIIYGPDDERIEDYGECGAEGDNVTWTLDDKGVLRIRGKDSMSCEEESHPWPYYDVKEVIISNGVTNICDSAFCGLYKLKSVTIPKSVKEIGEEAFNECTALKQIYIPDSVKRIGYCAFADCKNLSKIHCSNKLEQVGKSIFDNTKWLKDHKKGAVYAGTFLYDYKGKCPKSLKIKKGTIIIGEKIFAGRSRLRKVTFPNSLKYIERGAFDGSDLRSLKLPKKLKYIGEYAFSGNEHIKKLVVLKSVKEIGSCAFSQCGLRKVIIRNKNVKLGSDVFYATPLTDGKPSGPIYVDKMLCEYNDPGKKKKLKVKEGTTVIADLVFEMTNIKSISIPKSVRIIPSGLFYNSPYIAGITVNKKNKTYDSRGKCNAVIQANSKTLIVGCNSTKIPSSIREIGKEAFWGCTGLKKIIIPGNIKVIGYSAFEDCIKLKSLTIKNGVETIDDRAFLSCSSLKSVTVPASVNSIGEYSIGYNQNGHNFEFKKVKGFKIYGKSGSAAEQYAKEYKLTFISND